jgi:bifunctional non-homologous end joining protein LigD
LIKERDAESRPEAEYDVLAEMPCSTLTGRTLEDVAEEQRSGEGTRPPKSKRPEPGVSVNGNVPGARATRMPRLVAPQLAQTDSRVPESGRWLHEIKLDGYRLICHKSDRGVRLRTRSGQDWTDRFGHIVQAASQLAGNRLILDGEVVALKSDGVSSFELLQNAFRDSRDSRLVYFVFDLLYLDGYDLRGVALERRKELLRRLTEGAPRRL